MAAILGKLAASPIGRQLILQFSSDIVGQLSNKENQTKLLNRLKKHLGDKLNTLLGNGSNNSDDFIVKNYSSRPVQKSKRLSQSRRHRRRRSRKMTKSKLRRRAPRRANVLSGLRFPDI